MKIFITNARRRAKRPLPAVALLAALAAALQFCVAAAACAAGNDAGFSEDTAAADAKTLPLGSTFQRDISYGPDALQKFDVYMPPRKQRAPIIVMVHGGAWRFGDKTSRNVVENKAAHWLTRGMVFISVNYRLSPQADPVRQAADVALALAAIETRVAEWGGDGSKLILMGHSSGAHLAALLGANPAQAAGVTRWLGTVMLDSAALNTAAIMQVRHARLYDQAFGSDPALWRSASPFIQLVQNATPMFLVCSSRRADSCAQAHAFAARARELGVEATVQEENLSHAEINLQLGLPGDYTASVDRFIDARLQTGK